jgi:hypothetical protein
MSNNNHNNLIETVVDFYKNQKLKTYKPVTISAPRKKHNASGLNSSDKVKHHEEMEAIRMIKIKQEYSNIPGHESLESILKKASNFYFTVNKSDQDIEFIEHKELTDLLKQKIKALTEENNESNFEEIEKIEKQLITFEEKSKTFNLSKEVTSVDFNKLAVQALRILSKGDKKSESFYEKIKTRLVPRNMYEQQKIVIRDVEKPEEGVIKEQKVNKFNDPSYIPPHLRDNGKGKGRGKGKGNVFNGQNGYTRVVCDLDKQSYEFNRELSSYNSHELDFRHVDYIEINESRSRPKNTTTTKEEKFVMSDDVLFNTNRKNTKKIEMNFPELETENTTICEKQPKPMGKWGQPLAEKVINDEIFEIKKPKIIEEEEEEEIVVNEAIIISKSFFENNKTTAKLAQEQCESWSSSKNYTDFEDF